LYSINTVYEAPIILCFNLYSEEMQRHKEPLEFAESPHHGAKHYQSPVLAAQRPFLASSISAELLSAQWVRADLPTLWHENE
jgi:hypothetical protein